MPDPDVTPAGEYRRRADQHRAHAADAARRRGDGLARPARRRRWWRCCSGGWLGAGRLSLVVARGAGRRVRGPARRRTRASAAAAAGPSGASTSTSAGSPDWTASGRVSGRTGARFLDPHHPYADDLDLFGHGSLFELLCARAHQRWARRRSPPGCSRPPTPRRCARARRPCGSWRRDLDLREDLAVLGERGGGDGAPRRAGRPGGAGAPAGDRASPGRRRRHRGDARRPSLAWSLGWAPPIVALARARRAGPRRAGGCARACATPTAAVAGHGPDLELLAAVLERFEREPLAQPACSAELARGPRQRGPRPSQAVRRLRRLGGSLRLAAQPVLRAVRAADHVGRALRAGDRGLARPSRRLDRARGSPRSGSSRRSARWPASRGSTRPTSIRIVDDGAPRFEAEALGHPLMRRGALRAQRRGARRRHPRPDRQRLQHVGQEHAAARGRRQRGAGAGRRAGAGHAAAPLAALAVGATLRIQRLAAGGHLALLRRAGPAARPRPHRRRPGAAAVPARRDPARHQLARPPARAPPPSCAASSSAAPSASSPPTTWRCRRWRTTPASRAANVHFEDRLEDGQMVFDYRMRPGVVRTSNALALMRTLGLGPEAPER